MHHKLIKIAECLVCEVEKQTENLECVDTKELAEAIDMIKDLSKAIYYDVVTEAMLEVDELSATSVLDTEQRQKKKETNSVSTGYASYKKYLEAKEHNSDMSILIKNLETFIQDFSADIMAIINDASPEEKQYLNKKIIALANKVG